VIDLALACLLLAGIPALLYLANLLAYRRAPVPSVKHAPSVSVLIPARNEERSIAAAVESALASRGVTIEVVVLDDHSEDATATIVAEIARRDDRVRLLTAPPLPEGWCGKQHACHVLAGAARYPLLALLDADVHLAPDGLARLAAFQSSSRADLVSGIPHQETGTLLEQMVIPLIHFILLGFLPMAWMRRSRHPAFAAGCGQLFLATRQGYDRSGGHAAIRTTLHDGILLPRAFRAAGLRTDLCDATDLGECRMYRSASELWHGLAKNATEGLASPGMILPATLLLLAGQVLPLVLLAAAAWLGPPMLPLSSAAVLLAYLPRLVSAIRFRQSLLGALLHPIGVCVLLAIQWHAFTRRLMRRPASWKGRNYQPPSPSRSNCKLQIAHFQLQIEEGSDRRHAL
jgi:hypothetical protein